MIKRQLHQVNFVVSAFFLSAAIAWLSAGISWAAPMSQESFPFSDPQEAVEAAAGWLINTHQNGDGGFTSFSEAADLAPSDIGGTLDGLLALAAAGADVSGPLHYLETHIDDQLDYASLDGSTAGKVLLGLTAAGVDPHDFGGIDFVKMLADHLSPSGQYNVNTAFNQSLAVLGLAAAGEPVPEQALTWLEGLQSNEGEAEGSWDDGFGTLGNADATAMAIMALYAGGRSVEEGSLAGAVEFLKRTQLPSAGWEYGSGFGESANSTALVLQGLRFIGADVFSSDGQWVKNNISPEMALFAWQGESGALQADFGEGRFDNFFATVQSVPGLSSRIMTGLDPDSLSIEGAEEDGPTIAGGDSTLPYWIIGAVVLLLGFSIFWLIRRGPKDG